VSLALPLYGFGEPRIGNPNSLCTSLTIDGEIGNFVFSHLTIVSDVVFHPSSEERLFVVLTNRGARMFRYTLGMDDQLSIVSASRALQIDTKSTSDG